MWGPPEEPCLWAGDWKPALGLTLQCTHFQVMGASGALHLKGEAQDISNFKARLDSGTEASGGDAWRGASDLNPLRQAPHPGGCLPPPGRVGVWVPGTLVSWGLSPDMNTAF